jgi:hypothetical protein
MTDTITRPTYTTHAQVVGGRAGHGRTSDGNLDVDLGLPREFGGDGAGTNPEQLFAIGYAVVWHRYEIQCLPIGSTRARAAATSIADSVTSS